MATWCLAAKRRKAAQGRADLEHHLLLEVGGAVPLEEPHPGVHLRVVLKTRFGHNTGLQTPIGIE